MTVGEAIEALSQHDKDATLLIGPKAETAEVTIVQNLAPDRLPIEMGYGAAQHTVTKAVEIG